MKIRFLKNKNGFTLVESVISLAIFGAVVVVIGAFQRDVFFFNDVIQTGLTNITEAKKVLRPFVNEVRGAEPSNLGAFAIAEATPTSFTFYTDINDDDIREKVRYFVDGTTFKKGIIEPSGNPLVYDSQDENFVSVIHDVVPEETIFTYYDSNYNGTAETAALAQPVAPASVRLIRIDLTVDSNPGRTPSLLTITTQATVRNLKDNYED